MTKTSNAPEATPGKLNGRKMRRNLRTGDAPRTAAARSRSLSIERMTAYAGKTKSGRSTDVIANITAA